MKEVKLDQTIRMLAGALITTSLLFVIGCSKSEDQPVKTEAASTEAASTEPVMTEAPATETAPADAGIVEKDGLPVSTSSDEALALYAEGQYLLDVGRGVQAREKFIAAEAVDPGFALAYYGRSNAALSFAEFQQSLDAASARAAEISDAERLQIEINRSFLSNDSATGLANAARLVEGNLDSGRAWIILGAMQANQNENVLARKSYKKALARQENAVGAIFGLANNNLFGEPRDFAEAETWARKAIEIYPNEAKGYEVLGDIKRAQNDLEGALEAYNTASSMDPKLEAAAHKRGHVNSFLGNIPEARAAYDEAIAIAPPESKASYAVYRGFTNIHGGDIPAAIDELVALADQVEAMGTPPDQVKGVQVFALNSAAYAAMYAGLFDRAQPIIARRNALVMSIAEDVGTEDARRIQEANCQFYDGLLAAYMGKSEAATAHANAIADLLEGDDNPRKNEQVHWILGVNALNSADYAGAVEHLRQADYANTMYVRYQLALAEAGAGNTEEAKQLFADVASFNFNSIGFALMRNDAAERAN